MHTSTFNTNAHGELVTQTNYASVLCCNFGDGSTTCDGSDKILGLSSPTNAHAEAPDLVTPTYNTFNVCYSSFSGCRSTNANCGVNETAVVYLSNYTNAHLETPYLTPQTYTTKICCSIVQQPSACTLSSATWQYNNVSEGTNVGFTVVGQNCEGAHLSIAVYRAGIFDTPCTNINGCSNPAPGIPFPANNIASGAWVAGPADPGRYYFVASVVENPSISVRSSTPNILVTSIDCEGVGFCSDYNKTSDCNTNRCGINVQNSVPGSIDCNTPGTNCVCAWNSSLTPSCNGAWNGTNPPAPICGNGIIEPGETCDLANLGSGSLSCSSFDGFKGGTLSCNAPGTPNQCQINTSQCTGGVPGICGDKVVNAGEQCDGNPSDTVFDWGQISGCSNFDNFSSNSGTLSCNTNTCLFNTSKCTTAGTDIGTCYYAEDTSDTCQDDGFLDVNLTATWTWAPGNEVHYDPQNLSSQCQSQPQRFHCPEQIPLPFFGIYNLIAALLIIAVIYVAVEMNKKKGRKK